VHFYKWTFSQYYRTKAQSVNIVRPYDNSFHIIRRRVRDHIFRSAHCNKCGLLMIFLFCNFTVCVYWAQWRLPAGIKTSFLPRVPWIRTVYIFEGPVNINATLRRWKNDIDKYCGMLPNNDVLYFQMTTTSTYLQITYFLHCM